MTVAPASTATSAPNITLKVYLSFPDVRVPLWVADPSPTDAWKNARNRLEQQEQRERYQVARLFAERVHDAAHGQEVWFSDAPSDAKLTVIVPSATLQDELLLEAMLSAVVTEQAGAFPGFLRVYAEDEHVPADAREGDQLL